MSAVMLSAAKHLVVPGETLRFAQETDVYKNRRDRVEALHGAGEGADL